MKPRKETFWEAVVRCFILWLSLSLILVAMMINEAKSCDDLKTIIKKTATKYNVDPELALAIAEKESSFNPNALGSKGEIGLFQLRPEYHDVRPGEVEHNVSVAIKYLARLQHKCAHYLDAFFICYNLGPNYKRLKHPTKFPYYKQVKAIMNRNRSESVYASN